MDWSILDFLASPIFVIAWYALGIASALWVAFDIARTNTALKTAIKWAWPIIVLFFSVLGLALYFATARAPGVVDTESADEKKRLHDEYQQSMLRRVNGAVIHCVAGDGLGIMTAMVIARLLELTFWQEFWFEYAVGFAFGWFIFQYKSMKMMTDSTAMALWMAFRAEFFSMLTVMGGMGAVMTYVTPAVVGMQPKPTTAAFWGFGMLGLLLGYVMTFPMNWMLIKIGWKHGMGSAEGARPAHGAGAKAGLGFAMVTLGVLAMALPAWLAVLHAERRLDAAQRAAASDTGGEALALQGLAATLRDAGRRLEAGDRGAATAALDNARAAGAVARVAFPGSGAQWDDAIREARRELQNRRSSQAAAILLVESTKVERPGEQAARAPQPLASYVEAPLLNAQGAVIGEIRRSDGDRVQAALGGAQDVFGVWDLKPKQLAWLSAGDIVRGPRRGIGYSYTMLPTLEVPPLARK